MDHVNYGVLITHMEIAKTAPKLYLNVTLKVVYFNDYESKAYHTCNVS